MNTRRLAYPHMPALDGSRVLVAGGAHRVGPGARARPGRGRRGRLRELPQLRRPGREDAGRDRGARPPLGRRPRPTPPTRRDMAAMVDAAAGELGGLDVYVHCPSGGFEPRDRGRRGRGALGRGARLDGQGLHVRGAGGAPASWRPAGGGVIVAITDVAGLQPWPRFAPARRGQGGADPPGQEPRRSRGAATRSACAASRPGRCSCPTGIAGRPRGDGARPARRAPADVAQAVRFCIESGLRDRPNVVVDGGRLLRP